MFRAPTESQMRNEWIKSISKYQQFDLYSIHSTICELHFNPEDFFDASEKRKLKRCAVPSVFDISSPDSCTCHVNTTDIKK